MLFSLRVYWRWTESARLQARWVRIVPHVIDSCLLASALGMVSILGGRSGLGLKSRRCLAISGWVVWH
ncbi:MAG: SirB2 family protein [Hahellaceae bacterium]|nr:SirB2 family protein [Hahellaceae bacterium]